MAIETRTLSVGGLSIDLVRKPIKNLHLAVYPPDGRVRVAAPSHVSEDAIRLAVVTRIPWINKHRRKFARQERESRRRFVSGESHYFFGRRRRLEISRGGRTTRVSLLGSNRLELRVPAQADRDDCERAVSNWYRRELRSYAEKKANDWAKRLSVPVPVIGIRRMKTKWGSCSAAQNRIWLNLELAKKPCRCIEYVIVHELLHFRERSHGDRFIAFLDELLPEWREARQELNALPLAHEDWVIRPEVPSSMAEVAD